MAGPGGPLSKNTNTFSRGSDGQPSELRYLIIGKVVRAHGVHGELSVTVLTDFPERFEFTEWVYLGNQLDADPYYIEEYRWHKQNILLTLEGVTDRAQAKKLTGLLVQIPVEEAVPLPEGNYYLYQLYGLQVVTGAGEQLGKVIDIIETKANDVYVVGTGSGKEILLPDIPDVIKSIDLEQGQMTVHLIDGLI